jgi:hypothetical protein
MGKIRDWPGLTTGFWLSTSLVTFYEDDMSYFSYKIFICFAFSGDYGLIQDVKTILIITSLFLEGFHVFFLNVGTEHYVHENREQIFISLLFY